MLRPLTLLGLATWIVGSAAPTFAGGLPDLTPHQPSGWDHTVVPRLLTGANGGFAPLPTGALPGNINGTFFNVAGRNLPSAAGPAVNNPATAVAVDDVALFLCHTGNQAPGQWTYCADVAWTVKGGRHTVSTQADWNDIEPESNEANNRDYRQFIWSPLSLTADLTVQRTDDPPAISSGAVWFNAEGFKGTMNGSQYWYGYAVTPHDASDDFDVRLNVETPSNVPTTGFGAHVAWSGDGAGETDYCVIDRNQAGLVSVYASVLNQSGHGAGDKQVEWEQDSGVINGAGTYGPFTMGANDLIEIHEVYAIAGAQYVIQVEWLAGDADYGIGLHEGTTGFYSKQQAIALSDEVGPGEDEFVFLDAAASAFRGAVVYKRGAADRTEGLTYNLIVHDTPNLLPATPTGWHGPVVPRTLSDATETYAPLDGLLHGDLATTTFNFAVANEGATMNTLIYQYLFLDDERLEFGNSFLMTHAETETWLNQPATGFVTIGAGRRHASILCDALSNVPEYDETDNRSTEGFVWKAATLPADTPTTRSAPPFRSPEGFGPYYSIDGVRTTVGTNGSFWTVTAATPRASDVVYETRLYDSSTGPKNGFDVEHEWSIAEAYGATTFVVSNVNGGGPSTHDVGILNWNGDEDSGDYVVETEQSPLIGSLDFGTNRFPGHSLAAGEIVDAFEVLVKPALVGQPLHFAVHATDGSAVIDLHTFDGNDAGTFDHWEYTVRATSPVGGASAIAPPMYMTAGGYVGIVVSKDGWADIDLSLDYDLVVTVGSSAVDTPELGPAGPRQLALAAPHPNPVRTETSISFDVPASGGAVDLSVFDVSGRRVATLLQGPQTAGRHAVRWDGRDLAGRRASAGVYFVRMQSGGFRETKKLTLLP